MKSDPEPASPAPIAVQRAQADRLLKGLGNTEGLALLVYLLGGLGLTAVALRVDRAPAMRSQGSTV